MTPDFLITGPKDASITFAMAHGAGAFMDSPFMNKFAEGLSARDIKVVRFEFPYMDQRRKTGKKRPPDRMPKLFDSWRAVIRALGGPGSVFIGGKSMGGRAASMVAAELEAEGTPVRGVGCLGYPFHPPGRSDEMRIDHLKTIETPTFICQGARDTMGWWDEVVEYPLSDAVEFCWLDDGDHDFKPRVLSGRTMRQNHDEAIEALAGFLKRF